MLQSILASKMYKSSPRKAKILSAFEDPINAELVGQLAKALDEEYQTSDYLVKEQKSEDSSPVTSPEPEESPAPDDGGSFSPPLGGGAPRHSSPTFDADSDVIDEHSSESSESPNSESSVDSTGSADTGADSGSTPVEESTKVDPTNLGSVFIKKGEVVASAARSVFKDMRQVSDEVKGLLNFKDSTTGVNRILCKENELWIYYNDDVNLNNVMAEVIELLNASAYTYLEFNRLARSDNAMVFLISFADTDNVVKGISSLNTK